MLRDITVVRIAEQQQLVHWTGAPEPQAPASSGGPSCLLVKVMVLGAIFTFKKAAGAIFVL
jgi:hypothetical protein